MNLTTLLLGGLARALLPPTALNLLPHEIELARVPADLEDHLVRICALAHSDEPRAKDKIGALAEEALASLRKLNS